MHLRSVVICASFAFTLLFLAWYFANSLWLKLWLCFWGVMTSVCQ